MKAVFTGFLGFYWRPLPSVRLCMDNCGWRGDNKLSRRLSKLSSTPLLLSDLCPMQESNMKTLKIDIKKYQVRC